MGTSSSYTAPSTGSWPAVKRKVTYFAKQGGAGPTTPARVVSAYVQALGGKTAAASGATVGKSTARRLGAFLSTTLSQGLNQALEQAGLSELIGQDAMTVVYGLTDYLVGHGSTIEETVAKEATLRVLESLLKDVGADDIETVFGSRVNEEGVNNLLELFLREYVFARLLQVIQERLQKGAVNAEQAVRLEAKLKRYIKEQVRFKSTLLNLAEVDWSSQEASGLINSLFEDAYGVLIITT